MIIKLKRGNRTIKEILMTENSSHQPKEDEFSNVLNVRVNRPFTIAEAVAPLNLEGKKLPKVDIKDATPEPIAPNITFTRMKKEDNETERKFEASSNFIPTPQDTNSGVKTNTDKMLEAYGLTEKDFEEPEDNTTETKDEIEEKYRDLANEYSEDNFEKIPRGRNKNIDKY